MRIQTLKQGHQCLADANKDLRRLKQIHAALSQVPVKLSEQEFAFCFEMWGQKHGDDKTKWREEADLHVETIENYIKEVEAWIKKKSVQFRSALPLKKQRQLGMIPPV